MPTADPQAAFDSHGRLQRVIFAATLSLGMASGPFSIYALGALAPLITAELGISRAQLGAVTTVVVVIAAVLVPFVGQLVDIVGGRKMCLALFALAIVYFAAMAAAASFAELLVAAIVAGLSLSLIEPTTNQLIASHVPRPQQGKVLGVKQAGVQFGALVAGAVLPGGAVLLGWRGVLGGLSIVPALGLVGTLWVVPRSARPKRKPRFRPRPRRQLGASVYWLAGYAFIMGAGVSPVSTYLPLYAHEQLGLNVPTAGLVAALMAAVAIVARITWGAQSFRFRSPAVSLTLLAVLAVVGQASIWLADIAGVWSLWSGAVLIGASAMAWNTVVMLAVVREVDLQFAGQASGLVQSAYYFGFLASPIAFGASVDASGSYTIGWGVVTALFGLAVLQMHRWHRRGRVRHVPGRTRSR